MRIIVKVVITFADYSGNLSTIQIYPGDDTLHTDIVAGVIRLCGKLDAVSTAEIVQAKIIYDLDEFAFGPPAINSDVFERCVLLFRDGELWGSFSLPSVGALPFDTDGPYRGVRVTRENLVLSGMLADVESLVTNTLRPDGAPFPQTFYVGGRTRVQP